MTSGMLMLLGALLLIAGGAGLIIYSARVAREAVTRRVDFIRGPRDVNEDAQSASGSRRDVLLVRLKSQGLVHQEQREMIRLMGKLGIPQVRALASFEIARAILGGLLGSLALALVLHFDLTSTWAQLVAGTVCAGIAGWLAPKFIVDFRVKARMRVIARGLPDALELLVVCVEAGLSLDDGLDRVVAELWESHPALADELALTAADLKILPSRDQALANLADRVDLPSIRSIVGTLAQTMRFGTPLAQAMRVVANEMRNDALLSMEERANRLPALMTVPMIVFILPTIFMILGGPAVLRVIDTMSK